MQQLQQQREALLSMASTQYGASNSTINGGSSSRNSAMNRTFEVEPNENYMDLSELLEDDEFDLPKFMKYKKPAWATGMLLEYNYMYFLQWLPRVILACYAIRFAKSMCQEMAIAIRNNIRYVLVHRHVQIE